MTTTKQAEQARRLVFGEHHSYVAAGRILGLSHVGVWKLCNPEGRKRVECPPVATEAEHDVQRDHLTRVYRTAHPIARRLAQADAYQVAHPRAAK